MLATVPLCGGGFGPGDGFWVFVFVALLVAMAFTKLLPYLAVAAGLLLTAKIAGGFARGGPTQGVRLRYAAGRAEVRWHDPRATRLVADDAGLRVTARFHRPLEIDADAVSALEVVPWRGRYALVVRTRAGDELHCGRPCRDRLELLRTREALGRALRLDPVRSA